jgi:hypothetical protein
MLFSPFLCSKVLCRGVIPTKKVGKAFLVYVRRFVKEKPGPGWGIHGTYGKKRILAGASAIKDSSKVDTFLQDGLK